MIDERQEERKTPSSRCRLGYVQGMNDLLSPILIVMENEVDAFWCFVGLMDRMVTSLSSIDPRSLIDFHTFRNKTFIWINLISRGS